MAPVLEAHGHSVADVLAGLPVSLEYLSDPAHRIDWDLNVEIVQRTAALVGPGCLEEMGRRSVQAPPFNLFRLLGVLAADSRFLYRMATCWMGPSLFSHVRFDYAELPDGRIRLVVEIPEGYTGFPGFFEAFAGSFRVLPRMLGHAEAEVDVEASSHRGVFTIRVPRRLSLVGWLRSLLRRADTSRAAEEARIAVEVVAKQQRQLNHALEEMREAHTELRAHVEQLATLDRLGRTLSQQLASEEVPDRILEFLNERFGWSGSSLSMQAGDDSGLLFFGQAGATAGPPSERHPLLDGGRELGVLEVWSDGVSDGAASRQRLEKLLPWIAMTVMNARIAAGRDPRGGLHWTSKTGHDLFLILDAATRVLYAGPRVDEVLGYEAEDLQQMRVVELIHPDDLERVAGELGELSQHTSSAFYTRARLRMQGGDFRRMEGVAIKVLSEAGATVYLVSCSAAGEAEHLPAH